MTNVEMCGAATAWDDPITGHTSILEFHQGLQFGPKLLNSLINPNQCRMFGVSLCDDPFDPHRKLEIHDAETGTTIPLSVHGSTCNFSSPVPTQLELDALPRIPMTSDKLWDPTSVFGKNLLEEEAHARLVSSIKINQDAVCCHPNEPQSECDDPELDQPFAGVSSSIALETMLPRILSSVWAKSHSKNGPLHVLPLFKRPADVHPNGRRGRISSFILG
jgi:hypothetical protein